MTDLLLGLGAGFFINSALRNIMRDDYVPAYIGVCIAVLLISIAVF